jgi:two-component system, NarL family, nitrate/nitrite response regulator NarL
MAEDAGARTFGGSRAEIDSNIRLVIASPVHLIRDGLAATLCRRTDVTVVDVIDLDPCSIAKIAAAQPDVVLVDLGQTPPAAAARAIKAVCLRARLVAFALEETDDHVFACAAAGFCGYVARDSGVDELHRALVDAVEGRMHCAPHIAAAMFARLARLKQEFDPQAPLRALSSRESEILALVEQGRSNKEIARQLAISIATVKNHMHNILQKLQVGRRGQAVARLRGSNAA